MEQSWEFGLIGQAERGSKLFRQVRDIAEMDGQRLPLARTFGQRVAPCVLGGVSVVGHWFAFSPLSAYGW